jgi:hypothetical protein
LGVERSAVLGNHFGRSLETHVLRLAFARDLVVCGNRLDEPGADRHTIKLHAQQSVERYGRYAERIVISDNELRCAAPWAVAVGPQKSESDEAVRDVLIEPNRLLLSGNATVGFYLNSADTTLRNNLMVASDLAVRELSFVTVTQRGVEPVPSGVEVYHNTAVCASPGELAEVALVSVDKHAGGAVEVANNLLSAPGVRAADITRGPAPVRARGNVCAGEPDVAEAAVRDPCRCPAAPAAAAGVEVPVLDDLSGQLRPPGKPSAGAGSARAGK